MQTLTVDNLFVKEQPVGERKGGDEKPVLIVTEGPLRGQQWTMHGQQLLVGRGAHCDIVIPERRISREHVRIWRDGSSSCYVEDLNSRNGTHVNAERLEGVRELQEGDEIQIALSVKLKFVGSELTLPLTLEEAEGQGETLKIDPHTRQVSVNGELLEPQLSLFQYRLLELLAQAAGGVCTREDVIQAVWPDAVEEGISEQAIDALVRRLRDRLAEVSPDHQYVVTVRGHGFRLEQPNTAYEDDD